MGTTVLNGPMLVNLTGGSATKPPKPQVTTTPAWTMSKSKNTVRRVRPNSVPLVQSTTYGAESIYQTRGYEHFPNGNRIVSQNIGKINLTPEMGLLLDTESQYAFLEKVKQTTWNVGTFLGELPETIRFFADAAKALWKSYKAVKRGNLRKMRRVLSKFYKEKGVKHVWKYFSDVWLGWRYGVQPLVMEAESMMAALADTGLRLFQRRVSVDRVKSWVKATGNSNSTYVQTWSVIRRVRRGAYFTVNPLVDKFKRFGAINALEVLYELTPLSFVLDWFIPLGSAIASLDAEAGVSYVNTWKSSLEIQNNTISGPNVDHQFYRMRKYSRAVNGDGIPLPRYSPHMSVVRYFDFAALMRNVAR